jgi:hypothetical protein
MLAIAVAGSLAGAPAFANPYDTEFAACLMQNAKTNGVESFNGGKNVLFLLMGGPCNDQWQNWMRECVASGSHPDALGAEKGGRAAEPEVCALIAGAVTQNAFKESLASKMNDEQLQFLARRVVLPPWLACRASWVFRLKGRAFPRADRAG